MISMRKLAGVCIFCIVLGMFLMALIKDRTAGFIVMVILSVAGYCCLFDDG